jgi:trehalose/maltose transport system permease protein
MNEQGLKKVLLVAGVLLTVMISLGPVCYMLLTALSGTPDFLLPTKSLTLTLDHLLSVIISDTLHFLAYTRNSILISAAAAIISVFFASLAAYALTRLPLPSKGFFLGGVLALSMFPAISLVSYLFKLMAGLGWINTYPALILPYVAWTLPVSLWVLVSYFAQIPKDLDQAGRIDGASRLQILVKIIFPLAAPGVFSTALLVFILAFNEFLFALMLTTDQASRTIPVGIALFEGLHGQIPWGEIMAAATITTLPVIVLTLVFQRRIVQGLTRGAVKQ